MEKFNVLAVDEEYDNLLLIKKTLGNDYNVITADDANEALKIMEKTQIDLIITDQRIKGMSGLEFLRKSSEIYLDAVKIILTSYADTDLLLNTINNSRVYRYILKPWDPAELKVAVRNAIETYRLTIENKQLLERLKENYSKTMIMLATALEARDSFLQGHSERVAYASTCIARRLNVPQKDIDLLYSACLLHDIGRIGVPENVLKKPSTLDEEDIMYVEAHTTLGERILSPIPDFVEMIPLIKYHHERADGKGYPDGLVGEEIPLLARIIAVADTFDAIISDRPHRAGRSIEEALKILEGAKGTQLDGKIVDIFIEMAREKSITTVWELE